MSETGHAGDGNGGQIDRETLRLAFDADDPDLRPVEKETVFRFARDQDRVRFFTAEAGIGRRLLAHTHTEIDAVVVRDGPDRPALPPEEVAADDHVVGVRGTLPIGALLIRRDPRKSERHATIVSERVLEEVGSE
jgi:hypothetical protein